jgi:hypothetical protein
MHQTSAHPGARASHPAPQRCRTAHTAIHPGLPLSANGMPPRDRQPTSPQPHIQYVKDMRLLREYNKKYLAYTNYDPSAASLGESFYARYLSLSAIDNDTRANVISSCT